MTSLSALVPAGRRISRAGGEGGREGEGGKGKDEG